MRIEYVQKNYEVGEKLKEILQKKVDKLTRYFDDSAKVKILARKQNDVCKMEISIVNGQMFFRAEVSGDNMYENIDELMPKLEKQIFKHRTKLEKKLKSNAFKEDLIFAQGYVENVGPAKVVKVKKFDLKPMHIDDAIMELDLVDHDFYVYLDEKTNDVNIVYRRSDGDIGVIQPNVN